MANITGTATLELVGEGSLTQPPRVERLVAGWQPGEAGMITNRLDYDPPPSTATTTLSAATVDSTITAGMTATSPANAGSFDVASATGFISPTASTLAADLESIDLDMTLASTSGFDASGVVKVGTERIVYTGVDSPKLTGLQRGAYGTTIAAHSSGAAVRQAEYVTVESERIAYHTLSSNTLGDIIRDDPVIHRNVVACAANADISLASVSGIAAPGWISVEYEKIHFSGISGSDLTGVSRAISGTKAASHASSTAVTAYGYSPIGSTRLPGSTTSELYLFNGSGSTIDSGKMVGWKKAAGAGGGVTEATEGDEVIGITVASIPAGGWGVILAGGVASFLLDAATTELPGPGEPVFAKSSTTLMSLENADDHAFAVGRCLRTHSVGYDGATAISPQRVDFLMLPQLAEGYPRARGRQFFNATASSTQTITTTSGWSTIEFATEIERDSNSFTYASHTVTFSFTGLARVVYSIFAESKQSNTNRNEAEWRLRHTVSGPSTSSVAGSLRGSYHRGVASSTQTDGRNSVNCEIMMAVTSGDTLIVEGRSMVTGSEIVVQSQGASFLIEKIR